MSDVIKFSLLGMDDVSKRLMMLSRDLVRKKAAQSALGSAANVIKQSAKRNALAIDDPETGRVIADNIVQRFRSRYYKQTGNLMVSVGVNTKRGRIPKGNPDEGKGGSTPHWHLVEYGTEKARAHPFMRPALENNVNRVLDTFATKLEQQLDKVVP